MNYLRELIEALNVLEQPMLGHLQMTLVQTVKQFRNYIFF